MLRIVQFPIEWRTPDEREVPVSLHNEIVINVSVRKAKRLTAERLLDDALDHGFNIISAVPLTTDEGVFVIYILHQQTEIGFYLFV